MSAILVSTLNLAIVITGEGKPEVYLIEVAAENAFKFNRR